MRYPELFSRGKIGNLELKNRIVMPPMGTGFAAVNGEASDDIIRYYEERAKGGCALIITEVTRIDNETGVAQKWQLNATGAEYIPSLIKLADAVHRHDTKIFLQLHHPGRETPSRLLGGKPPVAPSPIACGVVREVPRELTTAECEALVQKYATGAVIAKSAGMDGVELHAAHGYLINQFMSPYTNKRTDKYGGNFVNRMRFITEIILSIRFACGADFPISVRISADEFIEGGLTLEDSVRIARYLESLGVCSINVSCGTYESGYSVIEPYYLKSGWKKHLAKAIKENVKIPVIAVNTVKYASDAEKLLEEGVSDFVAIGRGQLVDPEFGNRAKYGGEDLQRKCIGCMNCFRTANLGRPIACAVNPRLGRELIYNDDTLVRDGNGRTVAVIGAGPAGMHAATVLAKRGYKVVLFEKSDHLGGNLNLADKPAKKEMITELIRVQGNEMKAAGVEVRLGTAATVEAVKALNPYGVIIAAGGLPIVPRIPGVDKKHVYSLADVMTGKVSLSGKKVLVIGGGVSGLEAAEVLMVNNTVTVAEMAGDVATNIYPSVKAYILRQLAENGVNILMNTVVSEIGDGTVTTRDKNALPTKLEADAVVLSAGFVPDSKYISEFKDAFDKVTTVGDATQSGLIGDAMKEANDKAFVF